MPCDVSIPHSEFLSVHTCGQCLGKFNSYVCVNMPACQAFNCTNKQGECKKSFFVIPNPAKDAASKRRCKQWITNLKNGKLCFETYVFNTKKLVCEDHFTPDCFERNHVAESLNFFPRCKKLKPDAVPTLINTSKGKKGQESKKTARSNYLKLQQKRERAKLKENLLALKRGISKPHTSSATSNDDQENMPGSNLFEFNNQEEESPCLQTIPTSSITSEPLECENILPYRMCGHPCNICLQSEYLKPSQFASDHSYCTNTRTIGTMTEVTDNSTGSFNGKILTSTPIKKISPYLDEEEKVPVSLFMDDSVTGSNFDDSHDSRDPTFVIDEDESFDAENVDDHNDDNCDESSSLIQTKKFIVFENCLDDILNCLICNICKCHVDPSDTIKEYCGSMLKVSVFCTGGHLVKKWLSQPLLGKMPVANLLVCAATLFAGQTYAHISQFAKFMNLQFVSKTTFQTVQREIVMPVVDHSWTVMQDHIFKKIKDSNRFLRLAGDGRCDSPGFNAKYCTYSLLDMETQEIVAFVNIKVTETGSSSKMEVEGFRRCMTYLIEKGFKIELLATDRHVQIRSLVTKEFPKIDHQFDVWHLAKSIRKKLLQKSKTKGCEELSSWIRAICNHLWWCSANCQGDKQWLKESWVSIVHHVVNEHSFEGDTVTSCSHENISPEDSRKKKWLKKGSKVHNALKEVVQDKRLLKDIAHLSEFCHTGNLEVYHSLLTKYVPKRQDFDYDQMNCRTAIAVIDHNMSQNRGQKVDEHGIGVYKTAYSKVVSNWVAKPVYNPKLYKWVPVLMKLCIMQKQTMEIPVMQVSARSKGNIAPVQPQNRADLVSKLVSRFKVVYDHAS